MPRIYVASLSDYNAGRLHGRWVDATQDPEDIREEVREMLAESPELTTCQWCGMAGDGHVEPTFACPDGRGFAFLPGNAEEWAIHDYDGFGSMGLGEYESFEKVHTLACLLDKYPTGAVAAFYDNDPSMSVDGLEEAFEEAYCGEWESEKHYAYDFADSVGLFGDKKGTELEMYFDWDAYTKSLFSGDFWSSDTRPVHVFRSC